MAEDEKEQKEKSDVSLVKINSDLYQEASEMVEANQIDYPSIKNFVEVAVRNQLNLIRYDIENRQEVILPNGKLKADLKNHFTNCLACGNVFLNEKDRSKKGKKLCPKCTKIIKNLSKLVD